MPLDAQALNSYLELVRGGLYWQNAAGKWVRASAFRDVDYDPAAPGRLREFASLEEVLAFNEKCRGDGAGGPGVVHRPQPKDTVPAEQLAWLEFGLAARIWTTSFRKG